MGTQMAKDKNQGEKRRKWLDALMCVVTFFIARLGVGEAYYTVGIAYVGVLSFSQLTRRWAWLFGVIGILSLDQLNLGIAKYILIYFLVFAIRELITSIYKQVPRVLEIGLVGVSIVAINLIVAFISASGMYGVVTGAFEAIVGASICYLFYDGIEIIRQKRETPLTTKEAVSMTFIFLCLLGSFLDIYFKVPFFDRIYLKDVGAYIIVIGMIYLGDMNLGVTISLVISSVLVAIGYMGSQGVGIYGLSALLGGLFKVLGRQGIILGAGIGQMLGFMLFNKGNIELALLGSYLVAGLVSIILPTKYFGIAYWFKEEYETESEQEHLVRVQQFMTDRLKHVASGFEKLKGTLEKAQMNYMDYSTKELNWLIEETGEKMCATCSMREFCWKQDIKNTYQQVYQMLAGIDKRGFINESDIPEAFKSHCIQWQSFAYVLSSKVDLMVQEMTWQNKLLENRMLVAEELTAVVETLDSLAEDIDKKIHFNKEQEKRIKEMLFSEGMHIRDIMVLESREKIEYIDLYAKKNKKHMKDSKEISKLLTALLEVPIAVEKEEELKDEYYYRFGLESKYHVSVGSATCARRDISGDVHTFVELDKHEYLLALADGMGSGALAFEESAVAMDMLEDFMASGFRKDLVIKMINAALMLKSETEIFSTMDMTVIDRQSGVAEFLKAGASTSFILRNGRIITIENRTLPVGMVKEIEVEIQKFQLEIGDVIIMVTDGILETKEDILGKEETFKYFIKEMDSADPQYMANHLMDKSKALLGVQEHDDMTIIVARIW